MKLATRADGRADGRLLLVDPPLARAVEARACTTLLEALENWDVAERELRAEHAALASGDPARSEGFEADRCAAPLPRPAEIVAASPTPPLTLPAADAAGGLTVAVDVAALLGAVPAGADRETAAGSLRALTLAARLDRPGAAAGAWLIAPVAVTADAAGEAWNGAHLQGGLTLAASADATDDEAATAPLGVDVVARVVGAAAERALPPGTWLGPGPFAAERPAAADAPFRLDMRDGLGRSLFGPLPLG